MKENNTHILGIEKENIVKILKGFGLIGIALIGVSLLL